MSIPIVLLGLLFIFFTTPQAMAVMPLAKSQHAEDLAAPVKPNGPVKKLYRVGVLYWSPNIPGQVAMLKGLKAEAERINQGALAGKNAGVDLQIKIAGDDIAGMDRQIQQMYEFIHADVDIIIAQPTDNAALGAPLIAANQAGIPVVAFDQYITRGELTSYITSDNYQAGFLDGEYTAAHFDDDHEIRIVLVEYPHVSSTVERVDGFVDALRKYQQKHTIIKSYRAVEPASGKRAGQAILKDFPSPGSVDVVFTVNDGGGLSVVKELAAAGRAEIFVATIDGDPESVEIIKQHGITRIDSAQFCGVMGQEAMKTAYDILLGKPVKKHYLIPVFPITRETHHLYEGWSAPMPSTFTKPWPSDTPKWKAEIKEVLGSAEVPK